MCYMFCTSPHSVLLLCEDGIKFIEWIRMIEALTDERTDTKNYGRYNIIPSSLFVAGHNKWRKRAKYLSLHKSFKLRLFPYRLLFRQFPMSSTV